MAKLVFKDKEIKIFYGIVAGLPILIGILGLPQEGALIPSLIMFVGAAAVLIFGWPVSAELAEDGMVTFKSFIRHVHITPDSLASVTATGARDYRAHVNLRVKGNIPIGYRCRNYDNAATLAQAVLDIIAKAPQAKISPDALKLLQQTAKGSRKPLPLE